MLFGLHKFKNEIIKKILIDNKILIVKKKSAILDSNSLSKKSLIHNS